MDKQSSLTSKLVVITETLEKRKVELAGKKLQLLEAKRLGGEYMRELETEWGFLESEIDLLEHAANVIRMADAKKQCIGAGVTQDMVVVNANGKV